MSNSKSKPSKELRRVIVSARKANRKSSTVETVKYLGAAKVYARG